MTSLWGRFVEVAGRQPDRVALVLGDQRCTFGGWLRRSLRVGGWLLRAGIRPGDRVLVWLDPSPDMAAAVYGVWAMGGVVVLLDPRARPAHVRHAVRTTDASAILYGAGGPPPPGGTPDGLLCAPVADATGPADDALAARDRLGCEPASIVFTSGSTGTPKGVTQTHGSLARGCAAVNGYLGLRAGDTILCAVPWSFDYGFMQLQATAAFGATQVVPVQPLPQLICQAIEEHRPTVLPGTPSLFTYLYHPISPLPQTGVSSIRTVTSTGGTIPAPVLAALLDQFGHARTFLNYGLTESYRTSYLDPALVRERPASIGRPVPGADVLVLREDGTPAAPGESGQLVHRGDYLFCGYWNDPEATALALRPDPLAPPGCPNPPPALFTGDWGHRDADGLLYFDGRRDRQLKSLGVRVSPGEVEQLLHASGLVVEAAVFGRPHELLGDEVCAAVVPRDGLTGVVARLKAHARATMSPHMTPRRFLVRQALPKTTSGKIDYELLANGEP